MYTGTPLRLLKTVLWLILALVAVAALSGCKSKKRTERPYRMGELMVVGQLRYTIFDAEWREKIGEPPAQRLPRNRYLVVRLAVTNSGGQAVDVPTMQLENASGATFAELSEDVGAADWLGMIRRLKPADTMQGTVVFDAPFGAYRMRLGGSAEVTDETTAVVDIPAQYLPQMEVPSPAAAPQPGN
jgi:hypothetical protein